MNDAQAITKLIDKTGTSSIKSGNHTVLPGQTPEGEHILSVLLKRTYDIFPNQKCIRAEEDRKLISGDKHYGDPMNSTVEFEADFVPFKLATDVVMNGKIYAPDGGAVESLTASLKIGEYQKDISVIGDRVCHYLENSLPTFSDPEPFKEMELRYERAYGGIDIYSDRKVPCMYARNHLGKGFVVSNTKDAVDHLELPNLEDPNDLLTPERLFPGHFMHWEKQPMPQNFGWFSKLWLPRASKAGVMPADKAVEQELRDAYSKAVPEHQKELYEQTRLPDMDFQFFNGASEGLVLPYLAGHEWVELNHFHPHGRILFALPNEKPVIGIDIGEGLQEPDVFLHTVMIRMEDKQVDLVWRAAILYPGPDWLPMMRQLDTHIQ